MKCLNPGPPPNVEAEEVVEVHREVAPKGGPGEADEEGTPKAGAGEAGREGMPKAEAGKADGEGAPKADASETNGERAPKAGAGEADGEGTPKAEAGETDGEGTPKAEAAMVVAGADVEVELKLKPGADEVKPAPKWGWELPKVEGVVVLAKENGWGGDGLGKENDPPNKEVVALLAAALVVFAVG